MPKSPRPKPFAVGKVRVRVHSGPREDGRWRWRADRPSGVREGKEIREAVWSGWGDRDEAEKAVLGVLTTRGEEPAEGAAEVRTVIDLLEVWRADARLGDKSERTTMGRKGCAERLCITAYGLADVRLDRLDRRALDRFVRAYEGAPSTLRQDLGALRQAWAWGRERGYVPDKDLPRVRVRGQEPAYSRYTPTPEEVAAVLAHVRDRAEWPARALYLLWATGCRPGEIATLAWPSLDLTRGIVVVRGKTGERRVALHPEVVAEIRTWERVGTTVCGVRPATVRSRLHDYLRDACKDLEIERWSPYGLRRAAVSHLYRAGEDPSVSAALLGHSPAVALRHYRQVRDEDLRAVVRRTGLGLLPVAEETPDVIDLEKRRR